MDDELIAYLLEALPNDARQRVEARLRDDAAAGERLELFRRVLAPLAEDAANDEPPPGLALGTLARVAEHQCRLPHAPAACGAAGGGASWYGFRRVDLLVAACLLVFVAGLLMPFIVGLWRASGRASCQNGLRSCFGGLKAFAGLHDEAFPRVEMTGSRSSPSVWALDVKTVLQGAGAECPSSEFGCPALERGPAPKITAEQMDDLFHRDQQRYHAMASQLAPGWAYTLGYLEAGQLHGMKTTSGDGMGLLADSGGPNGGNSTNHGGGQNVLFLGGNVRYVTSPEVGVGGDHIYLNQLDLRDVGICRTDSVLAGWAGPRQRAD